MIAAGRVAVNGRIIDSPALNVTAADRVTLDGRAGGRARADAALALPQAGGARHLASATSAAGTRSSRICREDMPRVVSVGRLDLNSEGLLLLTNDGALKRRLELPSTGWLRKYRVRVHGTPDDAMLEPLRRGITVEGERFQPMRVDDRPAAGRGRKWLLGVRARRAGRRRRSPGRAGA